MARITNAALIAELETLRAANAVLELKLKASIAAQNRNKRRADASTAVARPLRTPAMEAARAAAMASGVTTAVASF